MALLAERAQVENTAGRFISSDEADVSEAVFEGQYFAGATMGIDYKNVNNPQYPQKGLTFKTHLAYRLNTDAPSNDLVSLQSELGIYQSFTRKESITLATRVGFEKVWGDYFFYQAPNLGGRSNLRGYRANRFYGNASFYHNTDLRIRLLQSNNSVLPFSLGVVGGIDYGRVWSKTEDSDDWHMGYGGGLWIAPIDFIVISSDYFVSDENEFFSFRLGYFF